MDYICKQFGCDWKSRGGVQVVLIFLIMMCQSYRGMNKLTDIFLGLALLFSIYMMVKGRFEYPERAFTIIFALYSLSILLSTIFSVDVKESLDGIRSEFGKQIISFGIILVAAAPRESRYRAACIAFFLSGAVMVTAGLFPYFLGALASDDGYNRLKSLSGSYTRLAYFLTLFVPFLALYYTRSGVRGKIIAVVLIALSLTAVFYTKTRGGWICVPIALLATLCFARKWKAAVIMCAATVAGILLLFALSPALRARAQSFEELRDWSGSFGMRKPLWESAAKTFREKPILGAGYGKYIFRNIYNLNPVAGAEAKSDTHNTFIEIAVQRGMLGLLTTMALYLFFLKRAFKMRKLGPEGAAYFAFFAGISTALFFFSIIDNLYVKETGRYLWQIAALGYCLFPRISGRSGESSPEMRGSISS